MKKPVSFSQIHHRIYNIRSDQFNAYKSKIMLKQSDKSVSFISQECGFNYEAHFTGCLRKKRMLHQMNTGKEAEYRAIQKCRVI